MPSKRTGDRCPLCGSILAHEHWLKVTGVWKARKQLEKSAEARGAAKERRNSGYLRSLLGKRDQAFERLSKENKDLKNQLKRGTTPQMEGLLFEPELRKRLEQDFRSDKITPHGKGGDILQQVRHGGKSVGRIVFECKRCLRLPSHAVEQTRRALVQRKADYAVLVTNATKKNSFGFWTSKDVLIVHPAGVIPLVSWLRDSLIKIAQANLTRRQRAQAVESILGYVSGPEFRTPLRDVVRRSEQLGGDLKREIHVHTNVWKARYANYQAIWQDAHEIGRGFERILSGHGISGSHLLAHVGQAAYPVEKDALLLPPARNGHSAATGT